MLTSYYHHHRLFRGHNYIGDLPGFVQRFIKGQLMYDPYFSHLEQAWKLREEENFLFIWFEEMKTDLPKVIQDLCYFLGYELSADKISALVDHVSIANMRQISIEMAPPAMKEPTAKHFRKGKVGDWKNYFEGEKLDEWNKWIEENLNGTGIQMSFE